MVLDDTKIIEAVNEHLQKKEDDEKRRKVLNDIKKPNDFVQNEILVAILKKVFHESDNVVQDVNILQIAMRKEKGEAVDEAQLDEFFEVMKEKGASNGEDRKLNFSKIAQEYSDHIAAYGDYKEFINIVMKQVLFLKQQFENMLAN